MTRPSGPVGGDLGQIRAALLGQSLGARGDLQIADDHGGLGHLGGGSLGGRSGGGSGLLPRRDGYASGIRAFLADDADVLQAGHIVALLEEAGQQLAGYFGLALERGLVGLVGEQNVAHGHVVSDILVPLIDDAAFDGVALTGHDHRRTVAPRERPRRLRRAQRRQREPRRRPRRRSGTRPDPHRADR